MHEGLLIVDQESYLNSKPWLFFNRSASKLINTFLGKLDKDLKGDKEKKRLNQQYLWTNRKFKVVHMDRELKEKAMSPLSSSTEFMSLEQIVMTQCDEPLQKNCIYRLHNDKAKDASALNKVEDKYY